MKKSFSSCTVEVFLFLIVTFLGFLGVPGWQTSSGPWIERWRLWLSCGSLQMAERRSTETDGNICCTPSEPADEGKIKPRWSLWDFTLWYYSLSVVNAFQLTETPFSETHFKAPSVFFKCGLCSITQMHNPTVRREQKAFKNCISGLWCWRLAEAFEWQI